MSEPNGKRATAAWLVPIVIAVMSYGGAQLAVNDLARRVEAGEATVTQLEESQRRLRLDQEMLRRELGRQRREVIQIAELSERIERAVRRAIEEALAQ
jgi:hypothetical protein